MRRKLKNNKGFAMAELLAVSMVILLLFSILFSNYLPLVAEYENRLSYNDVTAEYAGYYVRKMYIPVLNSSDKNPPFKTFKVVLKNDGYVKVYDKSSTINNVCDQYANEQDDDKKIAARKYCNSILKEYGVEEIIITNYSMTNVKDKYTESSGKLYKYIKYLPEYNNTIYKGNNDLYRIILKTKDGYATTPIDTDYYTPGSCFTGRSVFGGIEITKYNMTGSDCGSMVTIRKDKNLTMKNSAGKSITGKVVSIGNSAFKGLGITSINLNGMVKSIGASAFEGSKLERIDLSGVTSIGDSAFEGSKLERIDLSGVTIVGEKAFALSSGSSNSNILPKVDLSSVTDLGNNAFENRKINELDLSGSSITSISKFAFKSCGISSVTFSDKITSVGESSFEGNSFNNIQLPSSLTNIGVNAFKGNTVITSLNLPASLKKIDSGAFDSWSLLETIHNNSISFNDYDNWCMIVASSDNTCKSEKNDTGYAIGIGDRSIYVVNDNSNKTSENGGNNNE